MEIIINQREEEGEYYFLLLLDCSKVDDDRFIASIDSTFSDAGWKRITPFRNARKQRRSCAKCSNNLYAKCTTLTGKLVPK